MADPESHPHSDKSQTRTALITGANRGIGLGLTRAMLKRGLRVIGSYRTADSAEELRSLADGHGAGPGRVLPVQFDVRDEASIAFAAGSLREEHGVDRIDVLVNNAGIFPGDRADELAQVDLADMHAAFDANVVGPMRVLRSFLPLLKTAPQPVVANLSSGAATLHRSMGAPMYAYGVSKGALNRLLRSFIEDPSLQGVTVVNFQPGWVRTDMGGEAAEVAVEDCCEPLAETILRLGPADHGEFYDRFGNPSEFKW